MAAYIRGYDKAGFRWRLPIKHHPYTTPQKTEPSPGIRLEFRAADQFS